MARTWQRPPHPGHVATPRHAAWPTKGLEAAKDAELRDADRLEGTKMGRFKMM